MPLQTTKMTNHRWVICFMLFLATMVNYMDRQVLSLTWKDFIAPEFGWNDDTYALITGCFAIVYAVSMLFVGRLIDTVGTRRGYFFSIALWTTAAVMHALCGIATSGILAGKWLVDFEGAREALYDAGAVGISISTVSVYLFLLCRILLAVGEAGNFPSAIKCTAEFFPKKDRAYATSIFNNGASVGALIAPATIPILARKFGWEMAFIAVGAWGYLWMLLWIITYRKPEHSKHINQAELSYICQDTEIQDIPQEQQGKKTKAGKRLGMLQCLKYRQTWYIILGKFMTDGVWWFYLFWTPSYLSDTYGYYTDSPAGILLIIVLYLITMLSVMGGYLPTYFVNKYAMHPYDARMKSLLIFALIPLAGFFIHPAGRFSPLVSVILIGMIGAAHQSWSANIFSAIGDFFPKDMIATVTGIGGFAGGLSSFIVTYASGTFISFAKAQGEAFAFLGVADKQGAYMAIFCCLSVPYIIGWGIMKTLVPQYSIVNYPFKKS